MFISLPVSILYTSAESGAEPKPCGDSPRRCVCRLLPKVGLYSPRSVLSKPVFDKFIKYS